MKNTVYKSSILVTIAAFAIARACQPALAQEPTAPQAVRHEVVSIAAGLSHESLEVRQNAAQNATQSPDISLLDALVRALSDSDPTVRQRSAAAIRAIPQERADRAAIESFQNPDVVVRRELVQRFERRQTLAAVQALKGRLQDSDREVRQHAARILSENPHEEAATVLRGALEHKDRQVRFHATARLEKLAPAEALTLLATRLNDSDREVRIRAIQALKVLPNGAGDRAILAALRHEDAAVRLQAIEYFHNTAHPNRTAAAIDALAAALADSEGGVRHRAVAALRASKDERVAKIMLAALRHADPEVRRLAVQHLRESPQPHFIDPLIAALDDLDNQVRSAAAQALNQIGDERGKAAAKSSQEKDANLDRNKLLADAKTAPQLAALCLHRDNEVRRMAAESLRRVEGDEATQAALSSLDNPDPAVRIHMVHRFIERPEPSALPRLVKAWSDTDAQVRQFAALAVRRMDGDEAIQATLAALDHSDEVVRTHLLGRFVEKPHAGALAALVKILEHGDFQSRQIASSAIRRIDDEAASQVTLELFDHEDAEVRTHAVGRFQERPDARAVANLVQALGDSDPNVCRQAAIALRVTPGQDAKQALLAAFEHDDEQVRFQAVHRFVDQPDASIILRLLEMLRDPHESVRQIAAQAIGRSATEHQSAEIAHLLYHEDPSLRNLVAAKMRPMILDAARFSKSPLSSASTIERMNSLQAIAMDTPSFYVEMVGGDRIVGTVVGCVPRDEASESSEHLLIKPLRLVVVPREPTEKPTTELARIHTRWIRRIVWQSQTARQYHPGVVFLRKGSQIGFDSLRWEANGIAILQSQRIERIAFENIAELHLPQREPWTAYCEQLAVFGCQPTDKLVRLDYSDGSHLTASGRRFVAFSKVDLPEPNEWQHLVHPAWCLDGLAAPHRTIGLRSWLPATEAPLFLPQEDRSSAELWPWRANRNVRGGLLASGKKQYGWGFGVHADNVLRFPLPRFAAGFRTEVGLDRTVRDGGCARPIVRLRMGDNVRELYRGPLLIGSTTIQDTDTLTFAVFDGAKLELVADSAAREYEAAADPLNIRDMVNWLEPRLLLDADGLSAAVKRAAARLDPALLERDRIFDPRVRK